MSSSNERWFVFVFLDDPRMWVGTVVAGCGVWLLLKVSPAEMTVLDYAGGPLALAGAVLILLAVKSAAVCARLSREGTEVRGRVTAIKQSVWSRSSYVLQYRFRDSSGSEVVGRQSLLKDEALGWHEGEEGQVRFDATDSAQSVWLGRSFELEVATCAAALGHAAQAVAPSPTVHPEVPSAPAALPSRRVLFSRSRSTRWAWIIFCVFLFAALCLAIGIVKVVEGQAVDFAYVMYALAVAVLLGASVYKFASGRREVAAQLRTLRDGVPAQAIVTKVEEVLLRGSGGFITWSMGWIVSYDYTDHRSGHLHFADSGLLTTFEAARWHMGDRCPILIDAANPERSVWVG